MTPSNTELRQAIAKLAEEYEVYSDGVPGAIQFFADDLIDLFQAREQQLLTELLGEKQPYYVHPNLTRQVEAVPVSIIEKYREGLHG